MAKLTTENWIEMMHSSDAKRYTLKMLEDMHIHDRVDVAQRIARMAPTDEDLDVLARIVVSEICRRNRERLTQGSKRQPCRVRNRITPCCG